jgi:hypothetical protein
MHVVALHDSGIRNIHSVGNLRFGIAEQIGSVSTEHSQSGVAEVGSPSMLS